jgi:tetratricopeptide (TPR) repeat protein
MKPTRAIGLLGLIGLLGGGCAATQELTRELPGVKFVKYTMARADREQRASLDRGLTQLRAFEYDPAVRSLHQAIWDVELIDKRWLRLEELVEVHQALAEAYAGLGKNQWSTEQRALAQALAEYGRREDESGPLETVLAKAKAAYQSAHFREAVTAFGQALVELEGQSPTPLRLRSLVDARCHLVLANFALGRSERAAEEVRRLAALDGATVSCRRQSPPPVRTLITAVEASEARLGKRSAD